MNLFAIPTKFRYHSYTSPSKVPTQLRGIPHFNLRLPISTDYESKKARVLLVLGHIPTDDLRAKDVFRTTESGFVLSSILKFGRQYARRVSETLKLPKREEFGIAVIDFNYIKYYHLGHTEGKTTAIQLCANRVREFIAINKPTHVVFVGSEQQDAVMHEEDSWVYRGIVKKGKIGKQEFRYTNIIDFNRVFGDKQNKNADNGKDSEYESIHIVGHIAKQLAHICFFNRNPFTCPDLEPHPILVDTVKRFDKLMKKLEAADEIAVDTETTSLSKANPVILTIQFAINSKCGYVIPLEHKDTPFSRKELEYVQGRLRDFFRTEKGKGCYLGQNFKFDLTVIRKYLGVPIIIAPVWDAMGAEFVLDENSRYIISITQHSHLSLDNLLSFYGNDFYHKAKFSKGDRATIVASDLTKDVLNYCAMDVQCLHEIKRLQLLRACCELLEDKPYEKVYSRFVLNQLSSMVQIMSHMEQTGVPLDVKYTMELASKSGPLRSKLESAVHDLYKMKSVRKANRILAKKQGGASSGLFGEIKYNIFDIGKPAHKQLLYIDILDLAPVGVSKKTKIPSINAAFQNFHKKVPEVAALIDISKIQKLLSTYVEKFLNIISHSEDGKRTKRLFPSFGYITAVTGRGNSYEPNFQQIPSRGIWAKFIKRMFIAPPGKILIKIDFAAHEVRGWSIISGDKVLAGVFKIGRDLRKKYYKEGGEKLKREIELKGDVHKLNYNFFFKVPVEKVTKEQRDSVKSVVFGKIYGKGDHSLARDIKDTVEAAAKLGKLFFNRFKRASAWLEQAKKNAREKYYSYSPLGRRRNLFGYFFNNPSVRGSTDRMAMNAPIQGLGGDICHYSGYLFLRNCWKVLSHFKWVTKATTEMPISVRVMVHDSMFLEVAYEHVWVALHLLHHSATVGCAREMKKIFGLEFTIPPEIDIEIGHNERDLYKWDWSPEGLQECMEKTAADVSKAEGINANKVLNLMRYKMVNKELNSYLNENYPVFVD